MLVGFADSSFGINCVSRELNCSLDSFEIQKKSWEWLKRERADISLETARLQNWVNSDSPLLTILSHSQDRQNVNNATLNHLEQAWKIQLVSNVYNHNPLNLLLGPQFIIDTILAPLKNMYVLTYLVVDMSDCSQFVKQWHHRKADIRWGGEGVEWWHQHLQCELVPQLCQELFIIYTIIWCHSLLKKAFVKFSLSPTPLSFTTAARNCSNTINGPYAMLAKHTKIYLCWVWCMAALK